MAAYSHGRCLWRWRGNNCRAGCLAVVLVVSCRCRVRCGSCAVGSDVRHHRGEAPDTCTLDKYCVVGEHGGGEQRTSPGAYSHRVPLTPQSDLRDLLVLALGRLGGEGRRSDVLAEMDRLFGGDFTVEDREPVPTRLFEESWRNRASFEPANMVRDRLLVNRRDGIWELDRLGKDQLDRLSGIPTSAAPHETTAIDPLSHFAPKELL